MSKKGSDDAPDYSALAKAGEDGAKLGYDMGQDQMKAAKNLVATWGVPIAQAMDKQSQFTDMQGRAAADYMNEQNAYTRAIRTAMQKDWMGDTSDTYYYEPEVPEQYNYDPTQVGGAQKAIEKYIADLAKEKPKTYQDVLGTGKTTTKTSATPATGATPAYTYTTSTGDTINVPEGYSYNPTTGFIEATAPVVKAATPTAGKSTYKLATNQIIDDKFWMNGTAYYYTTGTDGNVSIINNKGAMIAKVTPDGKVVNWTTQNAKGKDVVNKSNQTIANAFLQARFANPKIEGALGQYNDTRPNEYSYKGKSYFLESGDSGAISLYDSAGKVIASYGKNAKGVTVFNGSAANQKLLQQALSDKSYYKTIADEKAAKDAADKAAADKAAADKAAADQAAAAAGLPTDGTYKKNEDGTYEKDADGGYIPINDKGNIGKGGQLKSFNYAAQKNKGEETAAAKAVAQMEAGNLAGKQSLMRQMRGMGIDPTSGAYAAAMSNYSKGAALQRVGAINAARTDANNKYYMQGMQLAGLGGNLAGNAAQSFGGANGAAAAGSQGMNATNGMYMNGLAAGTGTVMQGAQMGLGAQTAIANGQTNMYNANQNDGGMGAMLGFAGSALGKYLAVSCKDAKKDKEPIEGEAILEALEDVPVEKWTYKEGQGDEGTHIGPYAEDMNAQFGDSVAPGGKKVDLVSMVGLNMAALKEIKAKMDRIEHKLGMWGNHHG